MTLTINGEMKVFDESSLTISELLNHLELPLDHLAVELNQNIIPKNQFNETNLADKDFVEIVRFVGGG